MRVFYVLAYLPGSDYAPKLVADSGGTVRGFPSHRHAVEWCADNLSPDWEWAVLPLDTVEIYDMREPDEEVQRRLGYSERETDMLRQCDCPAHDEVVGTPKFEDLVCHVKVRCTECGRVFWRVYDSSRCVFDAKDCSLSLEK